MRRLFVLETGDEAADHRRARTRDAGYESETLPETNRQRAFPGERAALDGPVLRALNAQPVAEEQQEPVGDEEQRRDQRRGKEPTYEFFEQESDHHRRQGGDDNQPQRMPGIGRVALSGADDPKPDLQPLAPE